MIFVTIDTNYDDYLGHCDLDVLRLEPSGSPAALYNSVLDKASGLVAFIHSDVTTCGLEQAINRTIYNYGFNGALGVVGAGTKWARKGQYITSPTCDSCFIVVDANRPERFDEKNFDGFHLYVEDYCCQVGGATMIDINGYEGRGQLIMDGCDWFIHHSHTLRRQGCAWGDYGKYKQILNKKWGRAIHTT